MTGAGASGGKPEGSDIWRGRTDVLIALKYLPKDKTTLWRKRAGGSGVGTPCNWGKKIEGEGGGGGGGGDRSELSDW